MDEVFAWRVSYWTTKSASSRTDQGRVPLTARREADVAATTADAGEVGRAVPYTLTLRTPAPYPVSRPSGP